MISNGHSVVVFGAGSWGTALASTLRAADHRVLLYGRDPAVVEAVNTGRNERYLPGKALAAGLTATDDLDTAVGGARVVVVATPAKSIAKVCSAVATRADAEASIVLLAKGLERNTGRRLSVVASEALRPSQSVHVLLGPSHAEEVVEGQPTALVLAGSDTSRLERLQSVLSSPTLRVYTNDDLCGVEYAAALKNVLAIAAGLCDGLGLGDNAKGSLLARGVAEIARVGVAHGARQDTFFGLSGVGDVITTCLSRHSRNRALGERVGRGEEVGAAEAAIGQVVEGVDTTRTVSALAREHELSAPITDEVAAVLFEGKSPATAMQDLMTRRLKAEWDEPAGSGARPHEAS